MPRISLFPFVFFSSDLQGRRGLSAAERVVVAIGAPFKMVFRSATIDLKKTLDHYVFLRNAQERATNLQEQNAKLSVEIQVLRELETENNRLRQLLDFQKQAELSFLMADVQSADPSFLYRSVRLNKGENEGVSSGFAVVTSQGAVGMVMRTSPMDSDVLLITDANSNIDVIVSRNRRRGVLVGGAGGRMLFKHLDRGSRLMIGDEIVTSGLTGAFPRGVVVGSVASIKSAADGVTLAIEVEPAVNFGDIAEAMILLSPSQGIEVIRKIGGAEWMKKMVEGSSTASRSGGR